MLLLRTLLAASLWAALMQCFIPTAAAQTDDWNKIVAGARQVGEVIVWGQAGDNSRRFWKDAFEKDNPGITVRLFQAGNGSQRDTRVLREIEARVFKVDILVSGSAGMVGRLEPASAIQPLRRFLRPETLDGKNWLNGEPVWVDNARQYVMLADLPVGAPAITNESVPEGAIRSWDDLLAPKYDGKIVSLDPRQSGQAFAFSLFMYYSPDLGPSYVEKFFRSGRVVFSSEQRQIADWVDSGRMQIGFALREPEVAALLGVGSRIHVVPSLIAAGVPQTIVVGSDSAISIPNLDPLPHPNAARVYANWMFSRQGQQAMVDIDGLFSVRTDIDQSRLPARVKQTPGVKYTNANSENLLGTALAKSMRDLVTKAIDER